MSEFFETALPVNGKGDSVSEAAGGIHDLKRARRKRQPSEFCLDRLPPHADDMERGVLGCCLLSPRECIDQTIDRLGERPDAFYDLRNQEIWKVLVEMFEAREAIDVLTIHQVLKDRGLLDQIGGIPYLNTLQDSVPSASNVTYYADIVQEKYLLRKLIHGCASIVERAYEYQGEIETLFDEVERDMLQLYPRKRSARKDIGALVDSALEIIESKYNSQGQLTGLSTGLPLLDRYIDGLCPGDLIVPSAFTSVGKTSLLMNMVEHIVLEQNKSALIFSLEMTAEQLVTRFLCSTARVNLRDIANGYMAELDFPKLTTAAGRTRRAKLYIIDDVQTVNGIKSESRRMKQEYDIDMIGVDYIQRVHANVSKSANREQEVASISSGLKDIAKELKIPVVAPSQLNDDGKLRESRAIGQDADGVWELKRLKDQPANEEGEAVDLVIQKNRNGPRGVTVPLTFMKTYTKFEPRAFVSDADVPQPRQSSQRELPQPEASPHD